jgi:type I restriction enzyme M protein
VGAAVITGELKGKVDRVWDAFWSGGISNPLEVIEQITYLLFIRRLDDLNILAEKKARRTGTDDGVIFAPNQSQHTATLTTGSALDQLFTSLQSRAFRGVL